MVKILEWLQIITLSTSIAEAIMTHLLEILGNNFKLENTSSKVTIKRVQ